MQLFFGMTSQCLARPLSHRHPPQRTTLDGSVFQPRKGVAAAWALQPAMWLPPLGPPTSITTGVTLLTPPPRTEAIDQLPGVASIPEQEWWHFSVAP